MPTLLEDPTSEDIPLNSNLLKDFRKRCYEILLFEKPKKNGAHHKVDEWCNGIIMTQQVGMAPELHPGLAILWNKEDHSVDEIR